MLLPGEWPWICKVQICPFSWCTSSPTLSSCFNSLYWFSDLVGDTWAHRGGMHLLKIPCDSWIPDFIIPLFIFQLKDGCISQTVNTRVFQLYRSGFFMTFNVNVLVTEFGTGNNSVLWTNWECMVTHWERKPYRASNIVLLLITAQRGKKTSLKVAFVGNGSIEPMAPHMLRQQASATETHAPPSRVLFKWLIPSWRCVSLFLQVCRSVKHTLFLSLRCLAAWVLRTWTLSTGEGSLTLEL